MPICIRQVINDVKHSHGLKTLPVHSLDPFPLYRQNVGVLYGHGEVNALLPPFVS